MYKILPEHKNKDLISDMLTKQTHLDTLLTCNYAMKWFEIMKCTFIFYLVTITNL
jgi:hypothetical protein